MPTKNIISLSNITLIVALALSSVAAYYSIIGLTAIFAGAVIPVIIMGSILEVGKITTTVWLRKYWDKCGWALKMYLVPAVFALAVLTSMGIFGFLSKAHMDSGLVSGDVTAKLSLIDEKIKTQRDNIEIARKALQQMDAQVDARLSRGESEQGAERAVQIRRQQAGERAKLQKEIGEAQKVIAQLNEERAPIAAENRKVEAEVGPIKYVAALLYGDDPDTNTLERAVRWVIILLVIVFDPLAIALVLAANASKEWDKIKPNYEPDNGPLTDEQLKQINDDVAAMNIDPEPEGVTIRPFTEEELHALKTLEEKIIKDLVKDEPIEVAPSYLNHGFKYPPDYEFEKPLVYHPEEIKEPVKEDPEPVTEEVVSNVAKKVDLVHKLHTPVEPTQEPIKEPTVDSTEIITEGVTKEFPYEELQDGWVKHEGKTLQKDALRRLKPELFAVPDNANLIKTGFGTAFPNISQRGDVFVRVDVMPNRVFKFDGSKWIEINKESSSSYLDNKNYVQFLINKIYTGEYEFDGLTDDERAQIELFLKNQNS